VRVHASFFDDPETLLLNLTDGTCVGGPVDGRRFRMTFTLSGAQEHEEDTWIGQHVRIGDAVVMRVGHIGR
jgi:hypothetical protein